MNYKNKLPFKGCEVDMDDSFKFFVTADIDLKKSESEGKHVIRGYASTPDPDRQGDTILQDGLDIKEFVKSGFLNYDHDNRYILGYPTENTKIDSKGFFVEGILLNNPLAEQMWNLAVDLQKSKAPRRIGFSVEGRILQKSGSRIEKATIYNVAITTNPVNAKATWDAVVKSFTSDQSKEDMSKALEAGYGTSPASQSNGSSMRVEDLERAIHNLSYNLDNDAFWVDVKSQLASSEQPFTKSDAVVYLQLAKGLSREEAKRIIG